MTRGELLREALHAFLNGLLHLRWKGPNEFPCATRVTRDEELGWFEHGSTIILFAPKGFTLCESAQPGTRVRMGQRLLQRSLVPPGLTMTRTPG